MDISYLIHLQFIVAAHINLLDLLEMSVTYTIASIKITDEHVMNSEA